ncbi:hypothetical protein ACFFX1_34565 [Dactylosporangium sucinum]
MHRSQRLHGSFDPDTGLSVDVSLWKFDGRPTNVLVEFPGGTGEGNDLSPSQATELVGMLRDLLSTCAPEEFDPLASQAVEVSR